MWTGWPVSGCFGMLEPEANGWKSIGVLYGGNLDCSDHSVRGTPHNAHLTFLTPFNRESNTHYFEVNSLFMFIQPQKVKMLNNRLSPSAQCCNYSDKRMALWAFIRDLGPWDNQVGTTG